MISLLFSFFMALTGFHAMDVNGMPAGLNSATTSPPAHHVRIMDVSGMPAG
jgi:hypothetical protein